MAKRVIKMRLSSNSITEVVKQLKDYQEELKRKASIFIQRLCEIGIDTASLHKSGHGDSNRGDIEITASNVEYVGSKAKIRLMMNGKDVAFVEFGAGVAWNGSGGSSPNPYGAPLGMIIGSYGQGHGLEDFWFYKDESGEWVKSRGTEATMPMYYADRAIIDSIVSVAKEVF